MRLGRDDAEHFFDAARYVERLHFKFELAGLDFRIIQHVVDHRQLQIAADPYGFDKLTLVAA